MPRRWGLPRKGPDPNRDITPPLQAHLCIDRITLSGLVDGTGEPREPADKAAIKAMLVNRVGDFGLAPGISGRAMTSFLAATTGILQNDLKRVMAIWLESYSFLSLDVKKGEGIVMQELEEAPLRGVETSERALRERIVWRGFRVPVGVSGPLGLHLIVEEGRQPTYMKRGGGSLILRSQGGRRRPQMEATDALVIQLTPCCQSVLAVMLAKAGVSAGFTYYWI
ncbi:unnamed protein product [Dovyalis caffra]|uniref:Uncharacterized protein n=1 Tax=Dovyalis caffra TaxID=77055 RepID=A0AAV1R6Z5_9ROSI|nr:unnamed protein product [Dovyalis caffra]